MIMVRIKIRMWVMFKMSVMTKDMVKYQFTFRVRVWVIVTVRV